MIVEDFVSGYIFEDPTRTCCAKCNFEPFNWESNLLPGESSTVLCQLSYGGRCREHGHEFSLYYLVIMPMSRRVCLKGHCGIYTRLTVKFITLLTEGNFECQDTFFKTRPGPVEFLHMMVGGIRTTFGM